MRVSGVTEAPQGVVYGVERKFELSDQVMADATVFSVFSTFKPIQVACTPNCAPSFTSMMLSSAVLGTATYPPMAL